MTEQPQHPSQGEPNVPPQGEPSSSQPSQRDTSQPPQGQPAPGSYPPPVAGSAPQGPPPSTYSQPTGQMSPQDEKTWATLVHLSAFVAYIVAIPLLGPLIIYLVLRDRGPFIRHHAAQAVNFQIIIIIAYLVSLALTFVLIGIPLLIITAIVAIVFQIQAAMAANRGEWYRYPMTPDWVK
jgi:uncharacterized protein